MNFSNSVNVIFDSTFSHNLDEIEVESPTWIIDSLENQLVIDILRNKICNLQVTTFSRFKRESNNNLFVRIINAIDEHHGEDSQDKPYSRLFIYGMLMDELNIKVLKDLNFKLIENSTFGAIAEKA